MVTDASGNPIARYDYLPFGVFAQFFGLGSARAPLSRSEPARSPLFGSRSGCSVFVRRPCAVAINAGADHGGADLALGVLAADAVGFLLASQR